MYHLVKDLKENERAKCMIITRAFPSQIDIEWNNNNGEVHCEEIYPKSFLQFGWPISALQVTMKLQIRKLTIFIWNG